MTHLVDRLDGLSHKGIARPAETDSFCVGYASAIRAFALNGQWLAGLKLYDRLHTAGERDA